MIIYRTKESPKRKKGKGFNIMNILKTKIDQIKNEIPSLKDFHQAGFDLDYANDIIKDFTIDLINEVPDNNNVTIKLFNDYVNFKTFSVFGFNFIEYEEYEDFYHIGFLDVDYIISIKATNEIAILNSENSEIEAFISKDFNSFLELMPVLVGYDKIGYLGGNYTPLIKSNTLEEIKQILSMEKYYSFFIQSFDL